MKFTNKAKASGERRQKEGVILQKTRGYVKPPGLKPFRQGGQKRANTFSINRPLSILASLTLGLLTLTH
jgi:hypothetical protein